MANKGAWGYFIDGVKSLASPTKGAAAAEPKKPEPAKPTDNVQDGVNAIRENARKKKLEMQNAGN